MTTLNADQARHLKRAQETTNFLTKKADKYVTRKPIQKQVNSLVDNNKKINDLVPSRSQDGEAATSDKTVLKSDIATEVNYICSSALVYALEIKDTTLYNAVNYTATDVEKMRDAEVNGFVTTLAGVITPLLSLPDFIEYDVTAEDLQNLTKDAATYNDMLGDNKVIDKSSSVASAEIDALLADNSVIIGKLSKLMNYFKTNDPGFYQEYQKVIILDKSGIRHTGVRGVAISDATEAPVKGVSIVYHGKTADKNKTTSTGDKGTYELIKLMPGERTFTFTAPGYESQTITVKIIRGVILTLDITLQAQAISINAATA